MQTEHSAKRLVRNGFQCQGQIDDRVIWEKVYTGCMSNRYMPLTTMAAELDKLA